jgi:hypothetical protein
MKIYYILYICAFLLQSCNTENAWNCIQTVGDIVEEPFEVETFSRITVEDDIFLEIEQGETQSVVVTTGSNLLNDISVVVEADGNLRLKNYNKCNYSRDYDVTKITVTTPTLSRIRNASRNTVTSKNTLHFKTLWLTSDTSVGVIDPGKSGDFQLTVAVDSLLVLANGISDIKVSGTASYAFVGFYDEVPRFQGEDLIVQDLKIFHAAGNSMKVNPQQSIVGIIRGNGDVISVTKPPLVDVSVTNVGRLIFQ